MSYIAESITSGQRSHEPACETAALTFIDVYIDTKNAVQAKEAAAVAFVENLDKNPNFVEGSACAKAAAEYMKEIYP